MLFIELSIHKMNEWMNEKMHHNFNKNSFWIIKEPVLIIEH